MADSVNESAPAIIEEAHTSVIMRRLIKEAPVDHFTLNWLIGHLPNRSFGIIFLFLALISLLPIISIPSRFLILILTSQVILGYPRPVLPDRLVNRDLPSRYLIRLNRHAVPLLERLELFTRPRWPILLHGTRRMAAVVAFLLILLSLIAPLPLANMPSAIICILMALAYIEHDGLLLTVAFAVALILLISACILVAA